MNEAREVRLRTLANKLKHFGPRTPYPIVMGDGAKAIKELVAEVKDLERRNRDLEELLRREEARA